MAFPAGNFIRYLRSYGATPSNSSAFDEHVLKKIQKNNVTPVEIENPYFNEIINKINALNNGLFIVAGTAGDGKTYLLRKIWFALQGASEEWSNNQSISELKFNGKSLLFVKDLSAIDKDSSEELIIKDKILEAINVPNKFLFLAANDGQLLEKFKIFNSYEKEYEDLLNKCEQIFIDHKNISLGDNIYIYDQRKICNIEFIKQVIDTVLDNKCWSYCDSCECCANCPILKNKNFLKNNPKFKLKILDVFSVLISNDYHLTVRNLLLFITNIILGCHTNINKEGLLRCDLVPKIEYKEWDASSVVNNFFGLNLSEAIKEKNKLFTAISSLGIGTESSRKIDAFLTKELENEQSVAVYNAFIKNDIVVDLYNKFLTYQGKFVQRDNTNAVNIARNYNDLLQNLRRHIFLLYGDVASSVENNKFNLNVWECSLYPHMPAYLELISKVKDDCLYQSDYSNILLGLNILFTGLPSTNHKDDLLLTYSGSYSNSKVNTILLKKISLSNENKFYFNLGISDDLDNMLEIQVINKYPDKGEFTKIAFKVSAISFETIYQIAEGIVPSVFISSCVEKLLSFKTKLISYLENSDTSNQIKLLSLNQNGFMVENTVRIY